MPGAPLKVKWYQTGPGARRMRCPSVRRAICQLVERREPGGVDRVVLQGGDPRGVVEHEVGDAVQQRRLAPPFGVARQRDSLRAAVEVGDDERARRRARLGELTPC